MSFWDAAAELVDTVNSLPGVLVFIPRGLIENQLESRSEPPITEDVGTYQFQLQNVSPLKFTDIEIYLIFDFTDRNVGVSLDKNGVFVDKSMYLHSPLTLRFDSLGPLMFSEMQSVYIKSNLNSTSAKRGDYQIGIAGKFKAEPVIELPDQPDFKPPAIAGGMIPFSVVYD